MQSKLFRLFSRIFSSLMFVLTILFVFFIFPKQKALALTETRYMRSDTQTINGLSAYQLGITSSSSSLSTMVSSRRGNGQQNQTVYWGVRVWQRNNAGTETELTSGTPVAQVSRTSGSGIQSATWTPPSTTLATTDSIVIRVYIQVGAGGWLQGGTIPDFTTEQLGSTRLDNQTWTIYYNTMYYTMSGTPASQRRTEGTFYWGSSSTDSRITNFTHSMPVLTVAATGTQKAETHSGNTNVYIGGAFTFVTDQASTNVTSITLSNTGTVADSDLSNLILYYKQEATCSTTVPADATQFNSTPGSFSAGSSTVTGTMAVGTSQICLYVEADIGSAGVGDTIEIEISDPSTEVLVSSGSVTPVTAVAIGGTTYITAAGSLSIDIVDNLGVSVASPYVNFSSGTFRWTIQQTIATLGITAQQLKVSNFTSTPEWTLSVAATGGNTALWQSGSDDYKFNGLDTEGRLQINPSLATITPGGSCSSTGLTKQSSAYFVSGSVDSIDLIVAGSSAETDCDWFITGVGLIQDIPAEQSGGSYSLAMTITVI